MINKLVNEVHKANKNWWKDITATCDRCGGTGNDPHTVDRDDCWKCEGTGHPPKERNIGELLMLTVSELAEAMEGHRKNLMDDKLPHRPMLEVELADAIIRIFDLAGGLGLDLEGAYREKMEYNNNRPDHKIENRKEAHGKKY